MDTPERCEEIAKTLRDAGYKAEPTDAYLHGLATRLRNAGWQVDDPDTDDQADAQREANAGADQPNSTGRASRAASPGTAAKPKSGSAATS